MDSFLALCPVLNRRICFRYVVRGGDLYKSPDLWFYGLEAKNALSRSGDSAIASDAPPVFVECAKNQECKFVHNINLHLSVYSL